jgi:hypothetical protein
MAMLSHAYFAPILGRLIRARVPDLLEDDGSSGAAVAARAGLHPLATVRALRALTAFGLFREVAPSIFANSEASSCSVRTAVCVITRCLPARSSS